ncbi:unnamed protein product, partial [Symbiodinium necroappetens]
FVHHGRCRLCPASRVDPLREEGCRGLPDLGQVPRSRAGDLREVPFHRAAGDRE